MMNDALRHDLSRRHVVAGIATSLLATAACRGNTQPRQPDGDATGQSSGRTGAVRTPRRVRPLSDFGIDRFDSRDQWARLKRAFEAAHAEGYDLTGNPDARYRHDGALSLNGVSFDGQGCTLSALSDGAQVLRCIGRDFRIANVRLLGAATARTSDNWHNGIWVGDEGGQSATDFVLENVTVDAVAPGRGVAAAGFMFNDAHRGRILRPVVRHSLADGIHITNGSSDLWFDEPLSESTGDDGFAVVSYINHKRICRNIRTRGGASRDSAARGFTVVGGIDILYERPLIERAAAAGVYLYGEESFNTYGVARCRVVAPVIRDCVTGRGLPAGFSQGAITIGGRAGQDVVDGRTVSRGAVDCVISDPVVEGVGPACRAGIVTHQFAIRPRITGARLSNIVSTNPALQPNGVDIGGRDVVIERPRMRDVAGIAIVLTTTASGRCTVTAPFVDGSRLRGGPVDSVIYAEQAPALTAFEVRDGSFARGPRQTSISLLPPSKLRLTGNELR